MCSNSLRSDRLSNAVGVLKAEMRALDSLVMSAADYAKVPAGGALAVDRDMFSGFITDKLTSSPLCEVVREEVTDIPDGACIVATGPLTSDALSEKIAALPGVSQLNFYDAAAPVVFAESLDMTKVFRQSRYDRGDDYPPQLPHDARGVRRVFTMRSRTRSLRRCMALTKGRWIRPPMCLKAVSRWRYSRRAVMTRCATGR